VRRSDPSGSWIRFRPGNAVGMNLGVSLWVVSVILVVVLDGLGFNKASDGDQ
jgi:hypothetical protein